MALDKITGSKPQDIKKLDAADKKAAATSQDADKKPQAQNDVSTAQVSERSKAAIKAYMLAMDSRPFISRVSKVAQIKAQVISGTYRPPSASVADAVLKNIVTGV
jgi:anti-sigma28 factor (negative regulator of flagellin synthesis)